MIALRLSDFSEHDCREAAAIFAEYAETLGFSLDFQRFDAELEDLKALYGPPGGCLILAEDEGAVAGAVALKPLSEPGVCEMKRLYVRPAFRKTGLGRQLAEALITEARAKGYHTLKLDSLKTMTPALALYERLGFRPTAPYVFNPLPDAVYLALSL